MRHWGFSIYQGKRCCSIIADHLLCNVIAALPATSAYATDRPHTPQLASSKMKLCLRNFLANSYYPQSHDLALPVLHDSPRSSMRNRCSKSRSQNGERALLPTIPPRVPPVLSSPKPFSEQFDAKNGLNSAVALPTTFGRRRTCRTITRHESWFVKERANSRAKKWMQYRAMGRYRAGSLSRTRRKAAQTKTRSVSEHFQTNRRQRWTNTKIEYWDAAEHVN
jgi:hypothetical protein